MKCPIVDRAGPLHPGTSAVDFLGDLESVVDLYAKVANCAFDRAQISGAAVNEIALLRHME